MTLHLSQRPVFKGHAFDLPMHLRRKSILGYATHVEKLSFSWMLDVQPQIQKALTTSAFLQRKRLIDKWIEGIYSPIFQKPKSHLVFLLQEISPILTPKKIIPCQPFNKNHREEKILKPGSVRKYPLGITQGVFYRPSGVHWVHHWTIYMKKTLEKNPRRRTHFRTFRDGTPGVRAAIHRLI